MPRGRTPHFKVRTSIRNHRKMAVAWNDDALLATWLRLGVVAVERFAQRTNDEFAVGRRELLDITNRGRIDAALRILEDLSNIGATSVRRSGNVWWITMHNFAKNQRFKGELGTNSAASASASKREERPGPHQGPGGAQLEASMESPPSTREASHPAQPLGPSGGPAAATPPEPDPIPPPDSEHPPPAVPIAEALDDVFARMGRPTRNRRGPR